MGSLHPNQHEREHLLELYPVYSNSSSAYPSRENATYLLDDKSTRGTSSKTGQALKDFIPWPLRWNSHSGSKQSCNRFSRSCACSRRSVFRTFRLISYHLLAFVLVLVVTAYIYFPSYTVLPSHYNVLKKRADIFTHPGRGNPSQQKVFIAASLFDPGGKLVGGAWADNVLQLIDLLGPNNTFLSIYENDSGHEAQLAFSELDVRVPCRHSLVFEEHLGLEGLPTVTVPDGNTHVKRITYLAEVRNKALRPLDTVTELYDKVLYLNDVFFDPVDALQLLFSTNVDDRGQADYRAACAVDFINPFKFYDTFATRDLGGWGVGVPFFPWFAYGGDSRSHSDVVQGKDAVRVRACWGGMVAFDGTFFQQQPAGKPIQQTAGGESPSNITGPNRFRAEQDLFWDASECCLIHADIQSPDPDNTGIFMNPFVRCAYDHKTLSWLWFTRRFERLYTPVHFLIDILVGFPRQNPRRDEEPWQQVEENVWMSNDTSPSGGSFQTVSRTASHSGFCGRRKLPVMKENFTAGERNYVFVPIPSS